MIRENEVIQNVKRFSTSHIFEEKGKLFLIQTCTSIAIFCNELYQNTAGRHPDNYVIENEDLSPKVSMILTSMCLRVYIRLMRYST